MMLTQPRTEPAEHWGAQRGGLIAVNYKAADRLAGQLNGRLHLNDPVLTATFVSIDNLKDTTTFGRITAEQLASRLAQKGFRILDVKLRDGKALIRPEKGEFFLSRELKHISTEHSAQAILVGSYAVGKHVIHVSARMIRTDDNALLAADDYSIHLSHDVQSLL